MVKLSQVIRQDKKYENATTIEVHQAILQDYEDQFGDLLQRHSMMPNEDSTPDNPELKVDLNHLDSETSEAFSTMKDKYPNLYSTHKHHVDCTAHLNRYTYMTHSRHFDISNRAGTASIITHRLDTANGNKYTYMTPLRILLVNTTNVNKLI